MTTKQAERTSAAVYDVPEPSQVPAVRETQELGMSMFERMASDPQVDVNKLEKLMELHERALARTAQEQFNAAMAAAQADMRAIATDSYNPQTKSRYASYAALDKVLRPIYVKHGFAMSFNTDDAPGADTLRVLCDVTHIGGHCKTYRIDMPADGKGAKGGDVMTRTHATGAAGSYGMRYLLRMIWNIAVGEGDTDGNAPKSQAAPPKPDGLDNWLLDWEATADQGFEVLNETWKASNVKFTNYVNAHMADKKREIVAKARAVDKAKAGKA